MSFCPLFAVIFSRRPEFSQEFNRVALLLIMFFCVSFFLVSKLRNIFTLSLLYIIASLI